MSEAAAVVRNERVLAIAAAVSRLGGCVFLAMAFTGGVLVPAALAESAVLVAACVATRRVRAWWAVADAVVSAALFIVGAQLYNYVLVAVLLIGISPLRARWVVSLGVAVAGAYVVADAPVSPLWNVGPNAVSLAIMPVLAWLMSRQIRAVAVRIDARRAEAVRRAGDLAAEWERSTQAVQVRARLLDLLEELTDAVSGSLREQVLAEARWLRGFVSGDTLAPTDLRAALLVIAADRGRAGAEVTVDIADGLPALAPERIHAVTGAVWEALTNVAKHARAERATVRAYVGPQGLVVEVADTGHGFDPARTSGGVGLRQSIRRRLLEVGGIAVVESAPGRGTVVRLSLPDAQR
ncbi:ATP-binding protein [Actinocrispum sp. NPDC049592]|uniref:sensor histidine kinase n=1 Tax=Actinocrispum sp. NPDC049592 TaxID=3154835 RepID=UPI00344307C3